ncbi:MAG: bifunctional hydroxymethylpyrimidine kinase/phosphomethylpyrimidine kinase [Erythrobacter sp.]
MSETSTPPRILAIAGSDSSGGAGIQADIKTITMLGGYAMTALTAATAQNSVGVTAIAPMEADFVAKQIRACVDDIGVDAVKIGMLHDAQIIAAVAGELEGLAGNVPIILDPVMVATSGAKLIDETAVDAMRDTLFPMAALLTPNLPELELLTGAKPVGTEAIGDAAMVLAREYGCHVLAKGGHADGDRIVDLLIDENRAVAFDHARIETAHTHGTGCTLSSAIATMLGHGQPLEHAVRLGRQFVLEAIRNAPGFGAGNGPLGHQAVRKL